MRSSSSILSIFALFLGLSFQKDPINDICRRFAHQSTVIDRKLYIDGGFVNWNPIAANPLNYTNTWLLYNDLDHPSVNGMPQLYANLSKNASLPNVNGGILWEDTVNKRFYLFGGEFYQTPPDPLQLLSYDALNNQWDSYGEPPSSISRVSYGGGTSISERGEAYYYGGWMSNSSVPGFSGDRVATTGLLKYTMDSNEWSNNTGPDNIPRAEGVMVYLPISDRGMLVYFGGISMVPNTDGDPTMVGLPMSGILLYDIAGDQWYNQTASGDIPEVRRGFCAGATWAADQSSFNIYLYGGYGVPPNGVGFDDVYILSIPSFTWIKWYPTNGGPGNPHGGLTCNVVNGAQMLIIGGSFPLTDACDAPNVWATHNLDLGKQNPDGATWYAYRENITSYVVPSEIIAKIGGGPQGGATASSPSAGWSNRDLPVLLARRASINVRTPTRTIPTSTSGPSAPAKPLSTGAIAGIAVGGTIFLITVVLLGCIFIRRHRARRASAAALANQPPLTGFPQPPYSPSVGYATSPHSNGPASGSVYMTQSPNSPPAELPAQPAYTLDSSPPLRYAQHIDAAEDMIMVPKYDNGTMINPWGPYQSQTLQYHPLAHRDPLADNIYGPYRNPSQGAQMGIGHGMSAGMYGYFAGAGPPSSGHGHGQSPDPSVEHQNQGSPGSPDWADLAGSRTMTPAGYVRQYSSPAPEYEAFGGVGSRTSRRQLPGDMRGGSTSS